MQAFTAWCNGEWVPRQDIGIALDDYGFLQGAIVVDRLRTICLRPLHLEDHVRRFLLSSQATGIHAGEFSDLCAVIEECIERNTDFHEGVDFSVVMLATPGLQPDNASAATRIIHTAAIDWPKLAAWYQSGQQLLIADPRNVPPECWSPKIKTRSRLHYYLADRQAAQIGANVGSVLQDLDGHLTDTSVANLLIAEGETLVCPPLDSIFNGVGLKTTIKLAEQSGIAISYRPISLQTACGASEILLCGGAGLFWPSSHLLMFGADKPSIETLVQFRQPTRGPIYQKLQTAWQSELGHDYVRQAVRQSKSLTDNN